MFHKVSRLRAKAFGFETKVSGLRAREPLRNGSPSDKKEEDG
jgi:hypothetical protein